MIFLIGAISFRLKQTNQALILEIQHLIRPKCPIGEFGKGADFYALGKMQLAQSACVGAGFAQFNRRTLGG